METHHRRPRTRRGPLGRFLLHIWHVALHGTTPLAKPLLAPRGWYQSHAHRFPHIPTHYLPRLRSPARPWTEAIPDPAPELRTTPGIRREPGREDEAARTAPLQFFFKLHADAMGAVVPYMWPAVVSSAPRVARSDRRLRAARREQRPAEVPPLPPTDLTAALKAKAAELGISAVGVTRHDPKYTFEQFAGRNVGERVVVCILEQNYGSTQLIPSERSERAALATYGQLEDRLVELSAWLQEQGYCARPEDYIGESMFIHYAVAAGLGQLGLNGQLLTPQAGSRCRINVLTTDAPLEFDEPVDYGIEGVCDRCQACVRRCPVGAIPAVRKEHRGVVKAKLNTKRCLPVVTQAAGCSVCMKVCPVQMYGLPEVLEHYAQTGTIKGVHTDELEGFDWPLDGRHYGPGEKPRVHTELVQPAGFRFDPRRTLPLIRVTATRPTAGTRPLAADAASTAEGTLPH
jgi:epoxyqueuosine reductase